MVVPLVTALHATTEEHTYCAEHSAFEEVGASSGVEAQGDRAVVHGADAGGAQGGHERCAFDAFSPRESLGAASDPAIVLVAHAEPHVAPLVASDAVVIPLLLSAPKSSPPAHA